MKLRKFINRYKIFCRVAKINNVVKYPTLYNINSLSKELVKLP